MGFRIRGSTETEPVRVHFLNVFGPGVDQGDVGAVINTLEGGRTEVRRDGFFIRRAATEMRIPCFTSLDTARVAVDSIDNSVKKNYNILPLSDYRSWE